jgi:16S rRNA U516 pseudouridylate synthase RsuA-like enzyme
MINILPIYRASKPIHPRRESEREYLIRMARMRDLEDRRAARRGILHRITRGRAA